MKKTYLVFLTSVLLFALFFNAKADAGMLKNPFHKQVKKSAENKNQAGSSIPDPTLKAKAVYLELEGDSVEYDQESNIYVTSGMSVAHIVDQDAKLEADKIIYYGGDQNIEAIGNIKITRQGVITIGNSFKFDVTSDKYLLTKPYTKLQGAEIKARNLTSLSKNELEYEHGRLKLDEPLRIAQGFGARRHPRTFYSFKASRAAKAKPSWDDVPQNPRYRVTAEKIIYDSTKTLKNLTVYGARVHFRNFSMPAIPKYTTTVSSDPDVRSLPLLAPTFGTQGALGGFAVGPLFNFNLTDYHILSLSPFGQIGSEGAFGVGGMVGFYGPATKAEIAYGSLKDRFVGQFRQKFGRHLEFRTAYNQYLENGFLGSTLAQINVELVDRRKLKLPFTETGISFRTSSNWAQSNPGILPSRYKGFLEDAGNKKDLRNSAFKLEEQVSLVSKPLFKVGNENLNTALRVRTRNALRGYSTGDFQGIFTAGPLLDNKIGPLTFGLGYDQGYVKGDSPLFYDQFIQGMQSVSLDGDLKLHEWITLGGYGTYNVKAAEVIERQIRAKVGPKDFKMLVNWDALRQQTQFGLNFLFGQPVDFERFVIINSQTKTGGI